MSSRFLTYCLATDLDRSCYCYYPLLSRGYRLSGCMMIKIQDAPKAAEKRMMINL